MGFRKKRGSPFASEHREGIPQLALLANITLRQQNIPGNCIIFCNAPSDFYASVFSFPSKEGG